MKCPRSVRGAWTLLVQLPEGEAPRTVIFFGQVSPLNQIASKMWDGSIS